MNTSQPRAPDFFKVDELSRPEVHGHALKCARLDIQVGQRGSSYSEANR